MDSIDPIVPGQYTIVRGARTPVEPIQRITRERDRPPQEERSRKRRQQSDAGQPHDPPQADESHHIDIRV